MVLQNKNLWIGVLIIGLFLREVTPCWYDTKSPYASLWNSNKESCGNCLNDDGKIVGGATGSVLDWPWLGFLETDDVFTCTVELIAWNWAATAAHCIYDGVSASNLKVTFGRSQIQGANGYVRKVNKIIKHPGFKVGSEYAHVHSDIALLRLDASVDYNSVVRPICLSDADLDDRYDNCYVAGWGRVGDEGGDTKPTDEFHELAIKLLTNAECQDVPAVHTDRKPITDLHICARKVDGNGNPAFGGTCNGDSGGPLICQVDSDSSYSQQEKEWSLVGITSFGTPICGDIDTVDVFTRVSKFNQWITDRVDENGGPRI